MSKCFIKCVRSPLTAPPLLHKCDLLGLFDFLGDVVGSGTNFASTILTNNANKKIAAAQNATNYRIAQEANDLNDQHFRQQQQFDWDMFNRTNEYNSPAAMKERLLAAGINPQIALGNQGVSTAQSMQSPSASPAVVPDQVTPQLQAPQVDLSHLFEGFTMSATIQKDLADAKKANSEAAGQNITNDFLPFKLANELAESIERIENLQMDKESKKWLIAENIREYREKVRHQKELDERYELENNVLEKQADKAQAEIDKLEEEKLQIRSAIEIQRDLADSTIALNRAQATQIYAAAKEIAENINLIKANTAKVNSDRFLAKQKDKREARQLELQKAREQIERQYMLHQIDGLAEENKFKAIMFALGANKEQLKSKSAFAKFCLKTFGFGPDDLFSGLPGYAKFFK